jgi:plastocyanin
MEYVPKKVLFASLMLAILATLAWSTPARAANLSFTLIGHNVDGWGSTVSNINDPGPTLNAAQGDSVTLTLNGTDDQPHTWFIDCDGDSVQDTGEPISDQFEGVDPVTYTFTADRAGTFTYRCSIHPATMTGTIGVAAPSDNTVLIIGGVVVVVVIVAAAAAMMMRKKSKPPMQPPTQ